MPAYNEVNTRALVDALAVVTNRNAIAPADVANAISAVIDLVAALKELLDSHKKAASHLPDNQSYDDIVLMNEANDSRSRNNEANITALKAVVDALQRECDSLDETVFTDHTDAIGDIKGDIEFIMPKVKGWASYLPSSQDYEDLVRRLEAAEAAAANNAAEIDQIKAAL